MNWTMDKSLKLSRVCVAVFSVLLAALCISGPWFWKAVLHRENIAWLYLAVTYSTAVPAALVLLCLHRLLKNICKKMCSVKKMCGTCAPCRGAALPQALCILRRAGLIGTCLCLPPPRLLWA